MKRVSLIPAVLLICVMQAAAGTVSVTHNGASVGAWHVYELTITHDDAGYANVWEAAEITCPFTNAGSGKQMEIYGFYYDTDTWKVRFAPPETGTWNWNLTFATAAETLTESGSFTCVPSDRKGFVKRHPTNPYRIVYDDGSLFDGYGVQNCLGVPLTFSIDSQGGKSLDDYCSTFGVTEGCGFNVYRWSIDNCAFRLFDTLSVDGNVYRVAESKAGDRLCESLMENGFRIYLTFFGFTVEFGTCYWDRDPYWNPAQQEKLKHYLKYMVARYGAYTDMWEQMNEHMGRRDWVTAVSDYVRSIDPYNRMIGTSWEMPRLDAIDINAPHLYCTWDELRCDSGIVDMNSYGFKTMRNMAEKPVIYGEMGNFGSNWDPLSALRMRIKAWTGFFWEAIFIYWDTSYSKNYQAGAGNIYLGPEERGYVKGLTDFTRGVHPDVEMYDLGQTAAGIRSYGLRGGNMMLGYFHHFVNHDDNVNALMTVDLPQAGELIWYDPASGDTVSQTSVNAGEQVITSPSFKIDCAFKLTLDTGAFPAGVADVLPSVRSPFRVSAFGNSVTVRGTDTDALSRVGLRTVDGTAVFAVPVNTAGTTGFSTAGLPAGVYLVEVAGEDGVAFVHKVVVRP